MFDLIADDMRQCGLSDFAGEVRDVARPIPEAKTEAVNVAPSIFMRPKTISIAILESGLFRACPAKTNCLELFELAQDGNRTQRLLPAV